MDHPCTEAEAIAWWSPRVDPGFLRALSTPPNETPWTLLFVYPEERVMVIEVSPEGDLLLRRRESDLGTVRREHPALAW